MRLFELRALACLVVASCVCVLPACSALESMGKVEKSTTEVGDKMDKTNDGIDRTNKKMDETNQSIDETNNKMDDVRRQMTDMNDKLVETNRRMDGMNRALEKMYHDLRQGDSLSARLKTIEKLIDTPKLKGKTVFAAQYFMSFEYQLWKGEGIDGEALRLVLMRIAVDEFVQVLRRLSHSEFPISVLNADNDLASLEALAISMHMVNANAEFDLQGRQLPIESMQSILAQALSWGVKLEQGQVAAADVPEYAQLALKEPQLVKYLFELRLNMLPALVVNALSNVSSDDFLSRWTARAGVWFKPWTARTEGLNEIQFREYSNWMSWAHKELTFLNSLGLKPRLDPAMIRALKNMRLSDATLVGNESTAAAARLRALGQLKEDIHQFLSNIE